MPEAFKVFGSDFLGHEASVIRCLLAVQSSRVGRLDMNEAFEDLKRKL